MQITLKLTLAAAFTLASVHAHAADIPLDGTKNFSAPNDTPSYFTNETVPESARVNHQATFDSEEVLEPPVAEERGAPAARQPGRYGRHATAYRSARHAHGRYNWGGGESTHSITGRAGSKFGTSRSYTTKHARTGLRQHAAATLPATV